MTAIASPSRTAHTRGGARHDLPGDTPLNRYARLAGALLLVSVVAGAFGEFYVQSKLIVPGDAAATASNLVAQNGLFRLGFAAYLVEATCDVVLAWAFYVLLCPVRKNLALLAAFLGLVSTAVFAVNQLFYFGTSFVLGGAPYLEAFSAGQRNALAYVFVRFYGYGAGLFFVFYGVASIIRGYLIFRSRFLPRFLGVLLAIGGVAFLANNFTLVLAPSLNTPAFLMPMPVAMLAMTGWFLIKGVNAEGLAPFNR